MTRAAATTTPRSRAAGGSAKKAAAPPVEPITEDEDPGDGRDWAELTFQDRDVKMYRPTGGQEFVLLQTIGITDELSDDQEKLELALGFATMIRSLFVVPVERQYVTGALARGVAEIEDYFALAKEMAEHWGMEAEPPANNREERRARERRPVAKAAVRPRR